MSGWILYGLFLVVGIGMLVAGIYYLRKEKDDKSSVILYRNVSLIGVALAVASTVIRFVTV